MHQGTKRTEEPGGQQSTGLQRVRPHSPTEPTHIADYCLHCNELGASLGAQVVKNLPAIQETRAPPLGQENPLEKATAIHSSILAWRIPWTEPGGLQSMGSQRDGHD